MTTQDVQLNSGSFIQFDINVGCGKSLSAFNVVLESSTASGQIGSWGQVTTLCIPYTSCTTWLATGESRYDLSDLNGQWRRIVIPLSASPQIRFRWRSVRSNTAEWAVTNIHIGDGCSQGCGGHGYCISSTCVCDSGFSPSNGTCVVSSPIVTEFRETFDSLNASNWINLSGVSITSSPCGVLAYGNAAYVSGSYPRRMITADINTTSANVLNFYMLLGTSSGSPCYGPNSGLSDGIVIGYSTNGGISYKTFPTNGMVAPGTYTSPTEVTLFLPADSKTPATRFIFWQPSFTAGYPGYGEYWVSLVLCFRF